MKISNSKKQLAKIISENGGWREGCFAVQNGDHGRISFSVNKPVRHDRTSWMSKGGFNFKIEVCKPLPNWHQTILSRDEYFHLYPAPDADGWIEWHGGECPVEPGILVEVKLRGGVCSKPHNASVFTWRDCGDTGDIIAYRPHKPGQSIEQMCSEVTEQNKHAHADAAPTIEQLAADYRNLRDIAERKQKEADSAKSEADAKLGELERAGEALGFIITIANGDPVKSELNITD